MTTGPIPPTNQQSTQPTTTASTIFTMHARIEARAAATRTRVLLGAIVLASALAVAPAAAQSPNTQPYHQGSRHKAAFGLSRSTTAHLREGNLHRAAKRWQQCSDQIMSLLRQTDVTEEAASALNVALTEAGSAISKAIEASLRPGARRENTMLQPANPKRMGSPSAADDTVDRVATSLVANTTLRSAEQPLAVPNVLDNGVLECPSGHWRNPSNGRCVPIAASLLQGSSACGLEAHCLRCVSENRCLRCAVGFVLRAHACVAVAHEAPMAKSLRAGPGPSRRLRRSTCRGVEEYWECVLSLDARTMTLCVCPRACCSCPTRRCARDTLPCRPRGAILLRSSALTVTPRSTLSCDDLAGT